MRVGVVGVAASISLHLSHGIGVGAGRSERTLAKLAAAAARDARSLHAILGARWHRVRRVIRGQRKAERCILGGIALNDLGDRRIAYDRRHAIGIGNRAGAGHGCDKLTLAVVGHGDLHGEVGVLGLGPAVRIRRGLRDLVVVGALGGIGDLTEVNDCRRFGLAL